MNRNSEIGNRQLERTALQRLLLIIGSVGPLGHLPASGTATVAIAGVPLLYLVHGLGVTPWAYAAGTLALTLLAVWVHHAGDRLLGQKDSRTLVLDELAGFAVAMIGLPFAWPLVIVGFLVERTLDIVKVWPANWIERRWPGGWGVVFDDIVAGLYTCGLLHLVCHLIPSLSA